MQMLRTYVWLQKVSGNNQKLVDFTQFVGWSLYSCIVYGERPQPIYLILVGSSHA